MDIGEEMMKSFGEPAKIEEAVNLWLEDKITSPKSWELMLGSIKNFSMEKFESFIQSMEIEPSFLDFLEYCEKNNIKPIIVSDGFDFYINKIFKRYKITGLNIYANKLIINGDGTLKAEYPYDDEECKTCGDCKRNVVIDNSSDEEYSVYIGDGYSDRCPILYCDFIFAKRALLKYCEKQRISYSAFDVFHDIIKKLEEYKNKKNLKKRRQASLKRKELYLQG